MYGMKKIFLFSAVALLLIGLAFSSSAVAEENAMDNVEMNSDGLMEEDLKEKTIYFHNETGTVDGETVDTMNTTMGENHNIETSTDEMMWLDWYLYPSFASNFTLNGTASSYIWAETEDVTGDRNQLTIHMELIEIPFGEEDPTTIVQAQSDTYEDVSTVFDEYSVSTEIDEYEVSAGSTIQAVIGVEGDGEFPKNVAFGDSEYPSRLELSTPTYIDVENFQLFNSTYEETYTFQLESDGDVMHFNSSVRDPFGGYDVHAVYLTVEGPEETVFYRENMELVEGDDTSYRLNYTYEWDYSEPEEGEYIAIVSAVDNTGYNYRYPDNPGDETYGGHLVSEEKEFWIGAERYHVNLAALDSEENPMEGAEIKVVDDDIETEGVTDEEGIANISMRGDDNTVKVYWQDVLVNETVLEIDGDVAREDAIELNCLVYTPTYEVLDITHEPIQNVNLYVGHPNGTTMRVITSDQGEVKVPQLPQGEYQIRSEWLTKVVNQTSHQLDSNEHLTIHADVYYMDISVSDERGEPVSNVHITSRYTDTGRVADAALTDIDGKTTMRLPATTDFLYDLDTSWRGVSVGEEHDIELDSNTTLEIDLEIYYIDLHVEDSTPDNRDLEDARLRAYNVETGALANTNITDEQGESGMRLPTGDHTFEVRWKGVLVAEVTEEVEQGEMIEIQSDVYYLDIKVEDTENEDVNNAVVEIRHQGRLVEQITTNTEGEAPRVTLPTAEFNVRIRWRGVEVYDDTYTLEDNEDTTIAALIYNVDFVLEDDFGEPLGGASLEIRNGADLIASVGADSHGEASMRLPQGTHMTEIEWKHLIVYEDLQTIDNSGEMKIVVEEVYHVNFQGLDSEDIEVNRASVLVFVNGEQIASGRTDQDGLYEDRIPTPYTEPGEVTIEVQWRDVEVYEEIHTIESHRSTEDAVELELDIYYLEYELFDEDGEAVENARIFLRHSEIVEGRDLIADRTTDEEGFIEFRLPRGEQTLTARWKEIQVAQRDIEMSENKRLEIQADIYYLDIEVFDDRWEELSGAEVRITYPGVEKLYQSQHTDENGEAMSRIPAAEWDVQVNWRNTKIYSDSFEVSEEEDTWELELQAEVYYLTVVTEDKDGEELSDVHLRVMKEDRVWSGYTENGNLTFRLPARDDYVIEAEYETTYMLTQVEVNETETLALQDTSEETLTFEDYPIPFYRTNLFMFLGLLILIIAAIVLGYTKISEKIDEEQELEPIEEPLEEEEEEQESVDESLEEEEEESESVDESLEEQESEHIDESLEEEEEDEKLHE